METKLAKESNKIMETKLARQANRSNHEDTLATLGTDPLVLSSNTNTHQPDVVLLDDLAYSRRLSSSTSKFARHIPESGRVSEHEQKPNQEPGSADCMNTLTTAEDQQLEIATVQRPQLRRGRSSEETCLPPNPTPSTSQPRQKQRKFTAY
jgi:hypothetical protein